MQSRLATKDFWAGVMFFAFGMLALIVGSQYKIGEARQMGPGYFPVALGILLCVMGLVIGARGFRLNAARITLGAARPFVILVAVMAFALLVESGGMVLSVAALIVIGSLAARDVNLLGVLWLTVVLVALAVVIFSWGIGLPMPILPVR